MKMTMTNERNYATTKKFKSDSNVTAIDKLCSLRATTGLPPKRTSTYKTNEWTEATTETETAQFAQSANHVIFGMSVGNKKRPPSVGNPNANSHGSTLEISLL